METILTRIKVEILENTEWAREVNPIGEKPNKNNNAWGEWEAAENKLREFKIEKCHKDCNCEDWQTTPTCPCKIAGSIHSAEILSETTSKLVS